MTDSNIIALTVIVCDDIRREQTGKDIYIGLYGKKLIIGALPASLALSVAIVFSAEKAGSADFEFEIIGPADNQKYSLKGHAEMSDRSDYETMLLTGIPVSINEAGKLEFRLRMGAGEWKILRTIEVQLDPNFRMPIPNLSSISKPPPSEQSPNAAS